MTDDAHRREARRRIKARTVELLALPDDAVVMVSELQCTEPGCPPVETVVAVLAQSSPRRQVKIHKPVGDVSDDDLAAAFAGRHAH